MNEQAKTPSEREDVPNSLDRLWAREATDRMAAYRRGELAAKDLSEVVAKYLK